MKKNKQKIILLFLVLLILLLAFGCSYSYLSKTNDSHSEEGIDAITEIDYSKRQELLNTIVEEGKMHVNYSSKAVFCGTLSEKFNIKNVKNNHYPIQFSLYDEYEHCIYSSGEIAPGFEVNRIELARKLSKGVHQCQLKVGYVQEGNVSSVFPITIEVK